MAIKGLICKKIGMTQQFTDDKLIPVTVLHADSCIVTDIKTVERDGYSAIKLGMENISEKKLNKPALGIYKSKKIDPKRYITELRTESINDYSVGQEINVDIFAEGEKINVSSISKGKGFAGPMKRWNFSGAGASHGAHRNHRSGGSIGSSATPSRVFPGKKMAGQLGNTKVTVKNLRVISVNPEKNLITVRGAVPGAKGAIVFIKGSTE